MNKFLLCFALVLLSCQKPLAPVLSPEVTSRWMTGSKDAVDSNCSDTVYVRMAHRFLRHLNAINKRQEVFLLLDRYLRKDDTDLIVVEDYNQNLQYYSIELHKMSDTVILTFDFNLASKKIKRDTIPYGDNLNWASLCLFVAKDGGCAEVKYESNPGIGVQTVFESRNQKLTICQICVDLY